MNEIVEPALLGGYRDLYDRFLRGEIDAGRNRSDLTGGPGPGESGVENITQIMWPSDFWPPLLGSPYYRRALAIARQLLGGEIALDFDMMIDKAPHTGAPTPWHQDAAYWLEMPDRRAASCWLALDDATVDNGCMWFVPGSHLQPVRKHRQPRPGGALECDASEDEGVAVPLLPGSCTFHDGGTLHYSRGNSTAARRRALILNFRPEAMIKLERARGFDHGRSANVERSVRNLQARP